MVDATGVGATLVPVLITGGESESQGAGYYRAPKRGLITGLQVMLEGQELLVAKGLKDGPALLAVALACWGLRKRYGPKVGEVGRPLW